MMMESPPWLESRIGLLCGYILHEEAPPTPIADAEVAAALAAGERLWLHFNISDMRARSFVAGMTRLPERMRLDLLERRTQLRLEARDGTLVGELGDLRIDPADEGDVIDTFGLAVCEGLMVTVRRHPLKSLDGLRHALGDRAAARSVAEVFVELLGFFVAEIRNLVDDHSEVIDSFEDRILVGNFDKIGDQLGPIRRLLVRVRRRLAAERQLLGRVAAHLPDWFSPADRHSLRDVLDQLDSAAQDLDLVADRARLLQEEIASRHTEETNRNLFFLSVVTVMILPVTLITGIFGMNVGGLPWVNDGDGFFWVAMVMLATIAVSVLFLRRRKLF